MSKDKAQLYKTQLLDHYKNPRNKRKGSMTDMQFVKRGTLPRCGDDIEVGFTVTDDTIDDINFRGRGCSVCLASSSMLTEVVQGKSLTEVNKLSTEMNNWINAGTEFQIPETLAPLAAVKDHPARKKCVMLPWNALQEGLEEAND